MKGIVVGQQSWTETPAFILEEIMRKFPNLQVYYEIGKGRLSYLLHDKKAYRLGMVFPLTNRQTGRRDECIIYYPVKEMYVHSFCLQPIFPVTQEEESYWTKRGLMRIVQIKGKAAVEFTTGYSRVTE